MGDTNWQILTAGPRAGKTATLRDLSIRGHTVVPESARAIIDREISRGRSQEEMVRSKEFQESVMELIRSVESGLSPEKFLFMDRSILDGAAYIRYFHDEERNEILDYARDRYDNVFLLEQLPYKEDYAREESKKEAEEIHKEVRRTYRDAGYNLIEIPVAPIEERVQMILEHISDEKIDRHWEL